MIKSQNPVDIQKFAYGLIVIICLGWLLHAGASLIIPFVFAITFAVLLYPIEKKIAKHIKWKSISIVGSFLILLIPLLIITTLFYFQLISIAESLPSINESMQQGLNKLLANINQLIPFANLNAESLLGGGGKSNDLEKPLKFIGQGLISTTGFISALGLSTIYTFFLLYYKNSIKNFIIFQFEKSARPDIRETLAEIKETIQAYIRGLGLVIILLSVLNSIGLSLIGIENAIFWGVLAGSLAIIPFIGTLLGGMLPFLYALSSADATWQPIAVVIYYVIIQQIEGNFITPKIVGGKVDINPLFAIIALVFFGNFWGLSGIVLALPIISVLKIVLSNFDSTLPYATLMSSDITNKKGVFKRIADS